MELSRDGVGRSSLIFMLILLCMVISLASANVVLIGRNESFSVNDAEANFAPPIKGSGECGVLFAAEPLDACTPLTNKVSEGQRSPYVLVIRGGCLFDEKVRNAQRAGFKAVIVYDNEDSGVLVSMAGTSTGIHIHAVFVTKASGETLMKYVGRSDVETWIIPTLENSVWSIMAISFISLLAMAAVLATCFFIRRHRIRREQSMAPNMREFHGMRPELVRAMPSLIFTSVTDDSCTSMTCAICLEDYNVGEKLRVLPCRHKFHASCVDNWLTTWRSFCPVCKQDARTGLVNCPATERTPLLSSGSGAASPALSAALSSFHSSVASSPAIQIDPRPPRSHSNSRPHSLSSTPQIPRSNRSYSNSPSIHISRSSVDLRNASSPLHRSASQIASPHSFGFHMPSPRYGSPYIHSSSIGSHSYLAASSSRRSYLRHCNDSRDSLSGLASAHSLPGC